MYLKPPRLPAQPARTPHLAAAPARLHQHRPPCLLGLFFGVPATFWRGHMRRRIMSCVPKRARVRVELRAAPA